MKYKIIIIILMSVLGTARAQTAWEGMFLSQNYYGGTARFTAMGGAFAALGGDFSSLSVNPAGIGVSRGYELMITPAVNYNVTDAVYLNSPTSRDAYTRFGLDNLGISFSIFDNSSALKLNMGIGYNKINQNVSHISVSGLSTGHIENPNGSWTLGSIAAAVADGAFGISASVLDADDTYPESSPYSRTGNWTSVLGWKTMLIDVDPMAGNDYTYVGTTDDIDNLQMQGPVRQSYFSESKGSTGEYLLSFGGNVADHFYFGMNVGIQDIWSSYYESYSEKAVNSGVFDTGFKSMTSEALSETRGSGCNIKLGVIWRPVAGLRWGAYFHSPTWLRLTREYSARMIVHFDAVNDLPAQSYDESTPVDTYKYGITTPVKWGTGLAYVIGSSAIISVEYEGIDYSAVSMLSEYGSRYVKMEYTGNADDGYSYEDDYARQNFRLVSNLRAGAEYRLDALSFRLGYAYYGSPIKNDRLFARNIFSAGLGYRAGSFYVDAAYACSPNNDATYTLYDYSPLMDANSFIGKISLTLGFRF